MDAADLTRLREIAARTPEADRDARYAVLSDARMSAVAKAVIEHAENFDLDGEPIEGQPDAGLPMFSYISSLLTDILHFADMLIPVNIDTSGEVPVVFSPGGAKECLEQAISYASDSETPTYENLKGLTVR